MGCGTDRCSFTSDGEQIVSIVEVCRMDFRQAQDKVVAYQLHYTLESVDA